MTDWSPVAILPNLSATKAIEGEVIALASWSDERVQAFSASRPKFRELLSKFTDAFGVPLKPAVLIVRDDVLPQPVPVEAIMSFRDLVAMCVVPYARSLNLVYKTSNRIVYSNSFWLYPWMLGRDSEYLVMSTPAVTGLHIVDEFHGQSSPEISVINISDLDEKLFMELLKRWKRHYLGKRQRWQDRALFRSLNMANQAAQLPAGVGAVLYDLGRMAALWVSAFEILAHPRKGKSGLSQVYPLLERVSYQDRNVGRRRYAAYTTSKKPWPRRPLPCWLYGKLYRARCDFLHGNPIGIKPLYPSGSDVSLFWLAPSLYRLALTGFLGLSAAQKAPKGADKKNETSYIRYLNERMRSRDNQQGIIERALLRARPNTNKGSTP